MTKSFRTRKGVVAVLDRISLALGIAYGPSAFFLFAIFFLMMVTAHLSWELSRLEEKSRRLAEEVALLRARQDAVVEA